MNQVSLHFLKIQEDLAHIYKNQVRGLLVNKCLRPLENILALSALVAEKEKIIKSSTLDCDHFKSRRESELLAGKLSDHPTVIKLTEQLSESERVVERTTMAVLNFFDRIEGHISTMLGPETAVLVGALQHSHNSSAQLLTQLNNTLPTTAATLCELSAIFEDQKSLLKSPRLVQDDAVAIDFPAVSSDVHFLNVDVFTPTKTRAGEHEKNTTEFKSVTKDISALNNNLAEKCGYLKKKNKMKFWEERWFELREPGILTWYTGSAKDEVRNHLNMQDVSSIDYTARSCCISMELDGGRKTYELFADGDDLAAEWYEALVSWLKDKNISNLKLHEGSSDPVLSDVYGEGASQLTSNTSMRFATMPTDRPPPPGSQSVPRNDSSNQPPPPPPPPKPTKKT